jgi:tetratricopeptide (TPR) repeat protein
MPSRPLLCPRCQESLPEAAQVAVMTSCPRCGEILAQPETGATTAGGLRAPKTHRSLVMGIVAIVCLAVICGAGVVIYKISLDLWPPRDMAAKGSPASDAASPKTGAGKTKDEGSLWSHSRLVVVRAAEGGLKRPVVVLGHPGGLTDVERVREAQAGLLARELIRQAVLVAARDELGVATRDELLGDAAPDATGGRSADFALISRLNGPASVKMTEDVAGKKLLLDRDVHAPAGMHDLVDLATAAEKFSRTEFPNALKALGIEGTPNTRRPGGGLPDSVEERLQGLGFVDPLAAVREVHEVIRTDGESPARLGALVRGYAHLGVLNEFLWSSAHKVFKARAFLYAQRLIASDPKSPWGLWHRAYIEALAGLHSKALADLDAARKLVTGNDAPKVPAWAEPLAAYCHFDLTRLGNIGESQAKFARLLRLLALEYPHHSDVALRAGKELLSSDPECFRAHDLMYRVGGVSNLHIATMFAPEVLTKAVPRRIRAISELPKLVREPIDRSAGEVALVEALERAGAPGEDSGEPSWAVLGSLIRETRFVQVEHRLYFMCYWWHVPVEEFWNEARSLVARHRYLPYLLTMAIGTPKADQAFADSFDPAWLTDLGYAEELMIQKLGTISDAKRRPAWTLTQVHMDHLVRDFATQSDIYWKPNADDPSSNKSRELLVHNANKIVMLSPENPYAMAVLIEMDWDAIQPRLADWEKKHADFLPLVGALGRRYSVLKQYEKARGFLERYIGELPEHWAYERLAKNYLEQGDNARWLATLDQYLASGEDHGLDHAKVRVEIANYYMEKGLWAKAQPYAEAAAETWAGWAMQCAVRCYEGMQDWEQAELWVRRLSERYPDSSLRAWLNFCRRTGHGDIAGARALVEQFGADAADPAPAAVADRGQPTGPLEVGYSTWLRGSPKEAMNSMRKAYESTSPLLAGCALVVLADEVGDASQRDAILNELRDKHRAKAPKMFDVLDMFRDSFARGDRELPDLKALGRAIENVKPNARGNTEFYVGWLLRKRGKGQDAEAYLKRCIATANTNVWLKRIADGALNGGHDNPQPAKTGAAVPK